MNKKQIKERKKERLKLREKDIEQPREREKSPTEDNT